MVTASPGILPRLLHPAHLSGDPTRFPLPQHKGDGHVIIAQAFAAGRYLVAQDANMNRFKFCADHHPALRPLTNQQLASFTIDPAGSGLHWANLDLDIDPDGLHADATHHETPSSNPELDNHRLEALFRTVRTGSPWGIDRIASGNGTVSFDAGVPAVCLSVCSRHSVASWIRSMFRLAAPLFR